MRFFDPTILVMLLSVALSFIFPNFGGPQSPLFLPFIAKYGVAAIFFIHGASLSFETLKSGLNNWQLHIVSQTISFVIFPIIGFCVYFGLASYLDPNLRLGILFLSVISSTIASSITMTAIARGNIAGAVWDATISGIIGIFFTPILIAFVYRGAHGANIDVTQSIISIAKAVLLPFVLGHLSRPLIGNIIENHKPMFKFIDRFIIINIVFVAFCQSNLNHVWVKISPKELIIIIAMCLLILISAFKISQLISNIFGLNSADKIAACFVGSTKSLANGAPIAAILFLDNPYLSVILLPLLVYHQMQLVFGTILAQKWAKQSA